jgi:hypothetical protein
VEVEFDNITLTNHPCVMSKAIPASKGRPSRKAPAHAPTVRTAPGVKRAATEVKPDLAGVLEQVKAYRRADQQFKQAQARLVDAEARLGGDDPVEGVVVDMQPPAAKRRTAKAGSRRP